MAPDPLSMALKIRFRTNKFMSPWDPAAGYKLRPRSFIASVVFHTAAVGALLSLPVLYPNTPADKSNRPIYDELVKPDEKKIVWYAPRRPLPPVTALKRVGTSPTPRGRELSKDVMIATAPKAASTKQFIWRPVPKVEIHHDLDAPNMVLKLAAAVPVPAPPPPPEPKKVDRPNPEGLRAKQPNTSPPNPQGDVSHALEQPKIPLEVPQPRKAFVPPAPSKRPPRLPVPVTVAELPVPDASITGFSGPKNPLPAGLGAPVIAKGAPPPPANAPPGQSNSAGNAKMDLAIAGLNPADKLTGPLPEGGRPAQFSRAPVVGEPATGEVGGGVGVPDLTIREGKPVDPPRVSTPRRTMVYADKLRGIPLSTLSVPLRPASRMIPRTIDSRFTGRNVYTMVIPIEDIAPYSGDWILWFAEHEAKPGDTPFVRAPIPLRKF